MGMKHKQYVYKHGRRQDFCCVGQRGARAKGIGGSTGHMSLASRCLGACGGQMGGRAKGTGKAAAPQMGGSRLPPGSAAHVYN